MYGRYGSDRFGFFLLWTYIAVFFVSLLTGSILLYFAAIAIMIYEFFRMFSKNTSARFKENSVYLKAERKVKGFFKLQTDRIKDCRKRVYKKCPHCKAIVRLPRKGGKHSVTCPSCKNRFSLRILPFGAYLTLFITVIAAIAALIIYAAVYYFTYYV